MDLDRAATHDTNALLDNDEASVTQISGRNSDMHGMYASKSGLTMTVPRLLQDVKSLVTLTEPGILVLCIIRPTSVIQVFYGFGDASDKQFGSIVAKSYDCKSKLSGKRSDSSGLAFQIDI